MPRHATPHPQCYAPYTRCYSGAALITAAGRVHSGGYIESAAYNPTLSPFHSAVVDAVTEGLPSYDQVGSSGVAQLHGTGCKWPFPLHRVACKAMQRWLLAGTPWRRGQGWRVLQVGGGAGRGRLGWAGGRKGSRLRLPRPFRTTTTTSGLAPSCRRIPPPPPPVHPHPSPSAHASGPYPMIPSSHQPRHLHAYDSPCLPSPPHAHTQHNHPLPSLAAQISEVVLAEGRGAAVQHAPNVQLLLDRIAPGAALTVLNLR